MKIFLSLRKIARKEINLMFISHQNDVTTACTPHNIKTIFINSYKSNHKFSLNRKTNHRRFGKPAEWQKGERRRRRRRNYPERWKSLPENL